MVFVGFSVNSEVGSFVKSFELAASLLKSPVSRRWEEREDAMVRSSDSSERKDGCGFGGQ